jgi:hypothetical protein
MSRQHLGQAGTLVTTATAMTDAMAPLVGSDPSRIGLFLLNDTAVVLEVHTSLASTAAMVKVAAGAYYEVPDQAATVALWGKLASGTGNANVTVAK